MITQTRVGSDTNLCGNPQCSCRFVFCDEKLQANEVVRKEFITAEQANGGIAIGTLGISDVEFYLSRGFNPEQIYTIESDEDNFRCLQKRLEPYGDVCIIHGDLYKTILKFDIDSISSIFFDLYGLSDWDPFLVRNHKKLKDILRKCVSVQVTYPTGRSCLSGFRVRRDDNPGRIKIRSPKLTPAFWFYEYLSEISEAHELISPPSIAKYQGVNSLQRKVAMETFCVSRTTQITSEYTKGYVIYDSKQEGKGLRASE